MHFPSPRDFGRDQVGAFLERPTSVAARGSVVHARSFRLCCHRPTSMHRRNRCEMSLPGQKCRTFRESNTEWNAVALLAVERPRRNTEVADEEVAAETLGRVSKAWHAHRALKGCSPLLPSPGRGPWALAVLLPGLSGPQEATDDGTENQRDPTCSASHWIVAEGQANHAVPPCGCRSRRLGICISDPPRRAIPVALQQSRTGTSLCPS